MNLRSLPGILLPVLTAIVSLAQEPSDIGIFVQQARKQLLDDSYAILTGEVVISGSIAHPATGEKHIIRLAMFTPFIFHPLMGQLVLDNRNEYTFFIGYDRDSRNYFEQIAGPAAQVPDESAKKRFLADIGLPIDAVIMGFLFWDFIQESGTETIGDIPCRIVIFEEYAASWCVSSNESSIKSAAKVWMDRETGFPLKTEFYRSLVALQTHAKPLLIMTIVAWEDIEGVRLPIRIMVSGENLSIRFDFPDRKTKKIGYDRSRVPNNIDFWQQHQQREQTLAKEIFLKFPR